MPDTHYTADELLNESTLHLMRWYLETKLSQSLRAMANVVATDDDIIFNNYDFGVQADIDHCMADLVCGCCSVVVNRPPS